MKAGDLVRINRPSSEMTHGSLGLIIELCAPGAHHQNDLWRILLCDNTKRTSQLLFVAQNLVIVSESR